jgi:integrase
VKIKSTLARWIRRAQKFDLIGRNVAELVDLPQGQPGHPSRAMTQEQAAKMLKAASGHTTGFAKVVKASKGRYGATHAATDTGELACGTKPHKDALLTETSTNLTDTTCRSCRNQLGLDQDADVRLEALFVLSITLGLRPGELRKLTWDHVDLDSKVIHVWRSASRTGDVKTPHSKRSLVLPKRAVDALAKHRRLQAQERLAAGAAWQDSNLVFCHEDGRMYTRYALNWRFSKMTRRAGIGHWHAHEGRHTAVSIMSSHGVPLQEISDTVGHKSTHVTETVYRHVIVPAIRGGATVMDAIFGEDTATNVDSRGVTGRDWVLMASARCGNQAEHHPARRIATRPLQRRRCGPLERWPGVGAGYACLGTDRPHSSTAMVTLCVLVPAVLRRTCGRSSYSRASRRHRGTGRNNSGGRLGADFGEA